MGTVQTPRSIIDPPVVVGSVVPTETQKSKTSDSHSHPHSFRHSFRHWLEIDLGRLRANLASIRGLLLGLGSDQAVGDPQERTSTPMLAAVVKADAYGLGMLPVAQCLCEAGVDMLCVYCPDQAGELIAHSVACPILILMPAVQSLDETVSAAVGSGQVHLSVHHPDEMAGVEQLGRSLNCRVAVHLYLDTGMRRGGLIAQQLGALFADGYDQKWVRIAGVYTHFASADTDPGLTSHQYALLEQAVAQNRANIPADAVIHAANTCGVLRGHRYHGQMVRVGLGLFGYGPELMPDLASGLAHGWVPDAVGCRLQPVVRWVSRIVHVGRFEKGAGVGYGHTHELARASYLGLVPVGYCDGYPLSLSNRSSVRVWSARQGRFVTAQVVGQVSMDQIIVDLTDDNVGASGVELGGEVELISNDPASPCALEKLAALAGSNCYELLCRLNRVPRRYLDDSLDRDQKDPC